MKTPAEIQDQLSEPFAADEVEWKPQTVSKAGDKALAIAYIDARCVMKRLDEVVGIGGWQDHFEMLPEGTILCRLSVRVGDEWVTKEDVGGESDQKDPGDKRKAAVSDALKRAAVKFGVGRYLYSLPGQWVAFDSQYKRLKEVPKLPQWALPKSKATPQKAAPAPAKQPSPSAKAMPANGKELRTKLYAYDAYLAGEGLAKPNALVAHVINAGVKANYSSDLEQWSGSQIEFAVAEAKAFHGDCEQRAKEAVEEKTGSDSHGPYAGKH